MLLSVSCPTGWFLYCYLDLCDDHISHYLDNRDRKSNVLMLPLPYNTPHNLVAENWDEALGSDGYHESEPLWILRTAKNGSMDPPEGPTALRTPQNSTLTCGLSKTSEGILNWFHILEDLSVSHSWSIPNISLMFLENSAKSCSWGILELAIG